MKFFKNRAVAWVVLVLAVAGSVCIGLARKDSFLDREPVALPEVKCFNPAFDVTDHELLTGIVTEKGICYPPFTESLAALFKDKK